MEEKDLEVYKKKIAELTGEEKVSRDLYLKQLADGTLAGPSTGYSSVDKKWLKYYDDDAIKMQLEECNLYQYIKNKNLNNINDIAMEYLGKKITFKTLFEMVEINSKRFSKLGIKEGSNVVICMPNTPEFIYTFYALNNIGANVHLVEPMMTKENIEEVVKNDNAELLVSFLPENLSFETSAKKLFISPLESLPKIVKKIVEMSSNINNKIKHDVISYKSFKKISTNEDAKSSLNGSVIMNTGGTTAKAKQVRLSNNAINATAFQYSLAAFDFNRGDKIMFNVPNSLAYGMSVSMHLPLSLGVQLQIVPKFDPQKYDELFAKYKPNHIVGIPDWYQQLCNSSLISKMDLSFVKTAASGGAPMSNRIKEETNEFLKNHNCTAKVVEGYGMTEMGSSVVTNSKVVNVSYSVGSPLVKNNILIKNIDNGNDLQDGQSGEVYLTGPSVMEEYCNDDKKTKETIIDINGERWIKTGDKGRIEDGVLYIEGRLKRIIETYTTHKIYSEAVEEVIMSNPKIESCAIIPIPDMEHGKGSLAKAIIKVKDDYLAITEQVISEVKELCVNNLEDFSVPASIETIEVMPLTKSGKIDYKLLENIELEKIEEKNIKKR